MTATDVEYRLLKYQSYKVRGYNQGQLVIWYRLMGLEETLDILVIRDRMRLIDERY